MHSILWQVFRNSSINLIVSNVKLFFYKNKTSIAYNVYEYVHERKKR